MTEYTLPSVFLHYLESEKLDGISKRIAEFIATEKLSRVSFEKMLEVEGIKDISSMKEILLDQVLYYANTCVQDHELTDEEQNNLLLLNILFRIQEGDFLKFRESIVQHILSTQISQIIHDRLITKSEEIFLASLQRIFGLSEKQYTNLIRASIETNIEELKVWKENSPSQIEREKIESCIQVLSSIK